MWILSIQGGLLEDVKISFCGKAWYLSQEFFLHMPLTLTEQLVAAEILGDGEVPYIAQRNNEDGALTHLRGKLLIKGASIQLRYGRLDDKTKALLVQVSPETIQHIARVIHAKPVPAIDQESISKDLISLASKGGFHM